MRVALTRPKAALMASVLSTVLSPAALRAQVCWKKFCVYFDVEMRAVPVREDHLVMDPMDVPQHVDENTIGVVSIAGSTYNGQLEDVKAIDGVVGDPDVLQLTHCLCISCVAHMLPRSMLWYLMC
jgi:hypothetical protein